jgi:Low-density lipoprotein receptor domain class A.
LTHIVIVLIYTVCIFRIKIEPFLYLDTCQDSEFECVISNQCIIKTRTCDNIVNCADASDEDENAKCGKSIFNQMPFVYKF